MARGRGRVSLLAAAALLSGACAGPGAFGPRATVAPELPPYAGPKARVAVSRFDYKAAKGSERVGEGLSDMLTTELVRSNRFIVLERENLEDVLTEQDLATAGRISRATAAPSGEISGAELLVMGAVTAFEPNRLGLGGALLGGATFIGSAVLHAKNDNIPIVGATYTESYLAMDVRLVDTATSRVLASLAVEGRATDMGGGILMEVGGGKSELPLAFGGFQKTSAERAMRIAIARAVEGIVARLPGDYLRHEADVLREGELLGFSYLAFPAEASSASPGRGAWKITTPEELEALLESWGVPVPSEARQVDFAGEMLVAATGGQADRGSSISIQKVVNDAGAARVEIALLAAPEPAPGQEAEKAAGAKEKPPPVPFLVARVPRVEKPLDARWVAAPSR